MGPAIALSYDISGTPPLCERFLRHIDAVIGRTIIDTDEFGFGMGLASHGDHGLPDIGLVVVDRHDHRSLGHSAVQCHSASLPRITLLRKYDLATSRRSPGRRASPVSIRWIE